MNTELGKFLLVSTVVAVHCTQLLFGTTTEIEKIYHRTEKPTDYLHFIKTGEYQGDVLNDIRLGLQRSSKDMFIDFVYEMLTVFMLFIWTLFGHDEEQLQQLELDT